VTSFVDEMARRELPINLVRRLDGSVRQWDLCGRRAWASWTSPTPTDWYQGKLRALVDQGVNCFKTDFGERIPLEVDYFDGADPSRMHNLYTQLYNKAVHDYDYLEGLRLRVFPGGSGTSEVTVTTPDGRSEIFTVDLAEVTR